MKYDPAGGSSTVPLHYVDAFLDDLNKQHHPEPKVEEYRQVSNPEIEQYIQEMGMPNVRHINSQKKYSIVGKDQGAKDNPLYSDQHTYSQYEPTYDAISVGPPPPKTYKMSKSLKLKLNKIKHEGI